MVVLTGKLPSKLTLLLKGGDLIEGSGLAAGCGGRVRIFAYSLFYIPRLGLQGWERLFDVF